jgi:hypothetical protein
MYDPDKTGLSKLELSPSDFTSSMVNSLNEEQAQQNLSNVKQTV